MKAFQGHEDRLPSRILEALLSHLERLLDTHLAAGVQNDYPPLIIHLDMLAKVWRPRLLDNFRGRQGTPLEEKLTVWLIRLRPRASVTEDRHGRVEALEVLRKIGGSGLGRVIRHYLDSMSQSSKLDGLEFAFKTPDRQTIERVVCIATSETLWEAGGRQLPLLQSEGLKTLAATGSWAELVRAVIRWGTWSGPEIHSCRIGESPLEDDVVQPAIDALAVEGDPGFGPILALGIAARRDQLERIHKVCREVPADSPTAKGCSITLGLLNDDSAEALSFLTSQLDVEDHGTYAQAALLQIGSEAAHRTLLARLRERFDPTIALALLAWHESPEDVAALIIPHLKSACALRKAELLGCLFDEVEDGGRIDLVLSDPELRAQVAQEALTGEAAIAWMVGARPALIRAFSRWSSQKAYLAARQILHDANSADRERCAFLLSEIDPERAVRDIFALLALERSTKVRWAMGQALAGIASEEQLLAWLGSDSALERRSACFVAGYLGAFGWLTDRLAELSNDPDDDVVDAAIEALHRQRLASDLEELIGSYASEKEESRRWLILDAMTALGALGLEGCPPPDWVLRAVTCMNHPARNYFLGQLKKEQKRRSRKGDAASIND